MAEVGDVLPFGTVHALIIKECNSDFSVGLLNLTMGETTPVITDRKSVSDVEIVMGAVIVRTKGADNKLDPESASLRIQPNQPASFTAKGTTILRFTHRPPYSHESQEKTGRATVEIKSELF